MEPEAEIVAGEPPAGGLGKHMKKRALRNKALSVSFNEKDLRDFVTGFQKRKKKRRKEALKKQGEAERRKRLQDRKRRRLEKEYALYGGPPPETGTGSDVEYGEQADDDQDKESEPVTSVSGTKMYDNGDVKVTVTTSKIALEDEEEEEAEHPSQTAAPRASNSVGAAERKHNIRVAKTKTFKKASKKRSCPKLHNKRDRRKGKKNNKKRH